MFLKKFGILLSSLLFIRCNDSSLADYYSYLEIVKEQPKAQAIDDSKLHINCGIAENYKITDLSKTENICFKIGFKGLPEVFPEDLSFEFFVNDKKLPLPDSINYTIFTSIDRTGKKFNTQLTTLNINKVIKSVKTANNIPDSAYYINISGSYPNIPLNNTGNPEKIKIALKAISNGKIVYEKTRAYELKQPRLHKTKSRPFG